MVGFGYMTTEGLNIDRTREKTRVSRRYVD